MDFLDFLEEEVLSSLVKDLSVLLLSEFHSLHSSLGQFHLHFEDFLHNLVIRLASILFLLPVVVILVGSRNSFFFNFNNELFILAFFSQMTVLAGRGSAQASLVKFLSVFAHILLL